MSQSTHSRRSPRVRLALTVTVCLLPQLPQVPQLINRNLHDELRLEGLAHIRQQLDDVARKLGQLADGGS